MSDKELEELRAKVDIDEMNLNELSKECYRIAEEHGWHDGEDRSFGELVALFHSELSEALEEYREDEHAGLYFENREQFVNQKPKGYYVELIDCMIRILDYFGKKGVDIDLIMKMKMDYNEEREYRHGDKTI